MPPHLNCAYLYHTQSSNRNPWVKTGAKNAKHSLGKMLSMQDASDVYASELHA